MPRTADPIVADAILDAMQPRLSRRIEFVDIADSWEDALSIGRSLKRIPVSGDWLQTVYDRDIGWGFTYVTFAQPIRATRDDVKAWRAVAIVEHPPRTNDSGKWTWGVEEMFVAQTIDGFGLAKSQQLGAACASAAGTRSRRFRERFFVEQEIGSWVNHFHRSVELRKNASATAFEAKVRTKPYLWWLRSLGFEPEAEEMTLERLTATVQSSMHKLRLERFWPLEDRLGFLSQMDWDAAGIARSLSEQDNEALAALAS